MNHLLLQYLWVGLRFYDLQVLMNGVPIDEKHLTPEDFEEQLLTLIMKETQV